MKKQNPASLNQKNWLGSLKQIMACTLLYAMPLLASPKLATSDTSYEIPSEDSSYKYYLGVSDESESVKDGMLEAFNQAAQEAIRENYGILTQIDTDTYTTEKDNQILRRFRQQSGEIELRGFEKIDSKVLKDSNSKTYQVQALYRYNKIAIQRELARLSSSNPSPLGSGLALSTAGSLDNESLGGLSVVTEPASASLFLNGEPYLRSPINIMNQIPPGIYTLKIDHPLFETINEEVLIRTNETTKISKVLKPAHGKISFNTNPSGAEIQVNGKKIGKTPIESHKLLAGVPVRIDISHKDAYAMSLHAFSVEKDQLRIETLDLKMKPGTLVVRTVILGTSIRIDGVPQTSGESRFSLAPGPHNLEASAPGYQTHTSSIEIQSNRTVTEHLDLEKERSPSINTKTITKDSETPETSSDIASNFYLSIGVGLEALSSPVKNKPEATANNPAYVETQSDSKGPKLSPTFDIEIGLNQGFGVFYSGAVIPETSDSTATDGYDPMVVEANRKRFGVSLNFQPTPGNLFQIGAQSEVMNAEVTSTYWSGSYWSGSAQRTRTLAQINGRGLFFGWVGMQEATRISLKVGVMDYTYDHRNFKGTQSIYVSMGASFDLWRGWRR